MPSKAIIDALRKKANELSDAYMRNVGNPARQLVGGGVRGYFGLDAPEYADAMGMDAYRNAAAFSNVPGVGAPAGAVKAMAAAPLIAKALRATSPMDNAIVWHGSPHKFDRFDSSKIGTGEGSQAFGHGMYLAEDPKVAKSYIDSRGSLYKVELPSDKISRMLDWDKSLTEQSSEVQAALRSMVNDVTGGGFDLSRASRNIKNAFDSDRRSAAEYVLMSKYGPRKTPNGWVDKSGRPLSQESVDRMIDKIGGRGYDNAGQLYSDLAHIVGSQADVSAVIRNNGVPGIRYLDGGSRGASVGTRNFVVFPGEEGMLRILERDNQPLIEALRQR